MALIDCPNCGHKVSDRASKCPKCGCNISEPQSSPHSNKKLWVWTASAITLIAVSIGVWSIINSEKENATDLDAEVEITPEFIASIRQFDEVSDFSEGRAVVMKDSIYGYIDTKGNLITPCKYRQAFPFENNMACVYSDSTSAYGFINRKGELVIPCKYEEKSSFSSNGLCRVKKDGLYGFINEKGEVVIPLKYEHAGEFSDGLTAVTTRKNTNIDEFQYGGAVYDIVFIDNQGEVKLSGEYSVVIPSFQPTHTADFPEYFMPKFEDGICELQNFNDYGVYHINTHGEVMREADVEKIRSAKAESMKNEFLVQKAMEFHESINSYNIEPSEFVGLKDSLNIIVPAKYTSIGLFRNGVAVAKLSNVIDQYDYRGGIVIKGYVDKHGNTTFTEDDYKRFYADRKRLAEKEEEKARLEAERERIERERLENPGIHFTELMKNNAWRCPDLTIRGLGYRDHLEMIITFRPQTDNYGQATIVGWYAGREMWNRILTGDYYNYSINGRTLKIDAKNSNNMFPLIFEIENNGNGVKLQLTNPYLRFDMIPKSRNLVPRSFTM